MQWFLTKICHTISLLTIEKSLAISPFQSKENNLSKLLSIKIIIFLHTRSNQSIIIVKNNSKNLKTVKLYA
jgi:hypothetical protein